MELITSRSNKRENTLAKASTIGLCAVGVLGLIHVALPSAIPHDTEVLLQINHMTSVLASTILLYSTSAISACMQKRNKKNAMALPVLGAVLAGVYHWAAESGMYPVLGYPDITDIIYGVASIFPAALSALTTFKIDTKRFVVRQSKSLIQSQ